MSSSRYTMATVAACDPTFLEQALRHVAGLAGELRDKAGAQAARYGVIATGDHTGNIILFQVYEELNGIDRAFDVYGGSADYQALMGSGKIQVVLRNILKSEPIDLRSPSTENPAYGVLTRWGSADPMIDRMREVVPIFEENGALFMRYNTIMTGSAAGRRLLGVGYPSMDAIEKTYKALRESKAYADFLADVDLDWRNIIRFVG